jgi:hypothetical protein
VNASSGVAEQCQQCEDRKAAGARLAVLAEHLRVCRELEDHAPLSRYYSEGGRVRAISLAQFLDERWWAA